MIFGIAFAFFKIQNAVMKGGIRPPRADEIEGLDMPEMGVLAYPEFEQATSSATAVGDARRSRRSVDRSWRQSDRLDHDAGVRRRHPGAASVRVIAPRPVSCRRHVVDIAHILRDILVVLVAAKLAAEVAERVGIPAVVGEIVAGILIGPSVLGLVGSGDEVLRTLGELGVILLLLDVGHGDGPRRARPRSARPR